ncbi:MAG: 16S rRNA (uracil(1498)-N(3))-methyltransferase [Actinobacteria bacterium]|nr:16S rRNA (uracil(1498)-N(3))-methyltransferase [Actinomycetota bacterium]
MAHIPHLVVTAPWDSPSLQLSMMQWRHLTKVLRASQGDRVTYTDGLGTTGEGRLGNQVVERGEEGFRERETEIVVASAPPASKERQRYLVEKLAELGVARLIWLDTRHGKQRVASSSKVFSWVLAATEQSRGAWLMETGPELLTWEDLPAPYVVATPAGPPGPPNARTVVIGPEGGFAPDEVPPESPTWSLAPTILRVETAAVVAAARLLA